MPVWGAIEAGGTKFVCAVGSGPEQFDRTEFPTTTPEVTLRQAIEYFRSAGGGDLRAVGIGAFGPVDLQPGSPTYGYITTTPKAGWRYCDIAGTVKRELGLPVGFDTDVNAAVLAESWWGAGRGLEDLLYVTVGTGIGGGALVGGRRLHGLLHPEMGHVRVPHDRVKDPFPGLCPFHGDCLEGLAAGPAMEKRWGQSGRELADDHAAWDLEARYLALGVNNWVCTLSPRRVILGGGVMKKPGLLERVRDHLQRLLNGYVHVPEVLERMDEYVVAPGLGDHAGVLGAMALAQLAAAADA